VADKKSGAFEIPSISQEGLTETIRDDLEILDAIFGKDVSVWVGADRPAEAVVRISLLPRTGGDDDMKFVSGVLELTIPEQYPAGDMPVKSELVKSAGLAQEDIECLMSQLREHANSEMEAECECSSQLVEIALEFVTEANTKGECGICLDSLFGDNIHDHRSTVPAFANALAVVSVKPCGHVFHGICLLTWWGRKVSTTSQQDEDPMSKEIQNLRCKIKGMYEHVDDYKQADKDNELDIWNWNMQKKEDETALQQQKGDTSGMDFQKLSPYEKEHVQNSILECKRLISRATAKGKQIRDSQKALVARIARQEDILQELESSQGHQELLTKQAKMYDIPCPVCRATLPVSEVLKASGSTVSEDESKPNNPARLLRAVVRDLTFISKQDEALRAATSRSSVNECAPTWDPSVASYVQDTQKQHAQLLQLREKQRLLRLEHELAEKEKEAKASAEAAEPPNEDRSTDRRNDGGGEKKQGRKEHKRGGRNRGGKGAITEGRQGTKGRGQGRERMEGVGKDKGAVKNGTR
jgi:hypothetical protein